MKIVHIQDYFHPNTGYQVNVLAKYMAHDGHDVIVITSEMEKMPEHLSAFFLNEDIETEDQKYERQYGVKIIRVPIYAFISGRSIYQCSVIWKHIDEIQPDVLYVHGNDTYIAIRVFLRNRKFKCTIISDSHMADVASANPFRNLFRIAYRTFITPIICKRKIPIIRDVNIDYVMQRFEIPEALAPAVGLGTDTMFFHPDKIQREVFRKEYDIDEGAFVILYSGKLDASKGGKMLAELSCRQIPTERKVIFLVIGNAVGVYGQEVERLFLQSQYRILRFPTQIYSDLPRFYQAADIAVIAKECSQSIFDFASAGLPVVVEDNETNVKRINSFGEGRVFKSGDIDAFADVIASYANMEDEAFRNAKCRIAENVKRLYGYDKLYKKYMEAIEKARRAQQSY